MSQEFQHFQQSKADPNKDTLGRWSLRGIPNAEFYRKLHSYLKKWELTCSATKASIGRFYISIDKQLQERGSTPNNTYLFIEKVVCSKKSDTALMPYAITTQLKAVQQVHEDEATYQEYCYDLELENTKTELLNVQENFKKLTHEKNILLRERDNANQKLHHLNEINKSTISDMLRREEILIAKNSELLQENMSLKSKLFLTAGTSTSNNQLQLIKHDDIICTKIENAYSQHVRELYYKLLADQIPPAKVESTIKSVLNCFFPTLNTSNLKLPREKCAGYMRREEMHTICMAHKAYSISESDSLNLNSDGTTKFQKKIAAVSFNGMVLCLNEVPDGSADSMVEMVEAELEKLRKIACALKLSNPNKINWTLFNSLTSDSASAQKRFNRLVEERCKRDEKCLGSATSEAIELVENLCAMLLGSNLRKAFLEGSKDHDTLPLQSHREHDQTDTFIHEFCKLFGKHGTPEYVCGSLTFPDFLTIKSKDQTTNYYQLCSNVVLDRQVGSRYFVSASNACKIFFLANAATEFLEYTGKDKGNNLEQTVYSKLRSAPDLSRLKADALMFYFVYADIVMLAKSNKLNKSAFDMKQHYLELQQFLQGIEKDPKVVLHKTHKVFPSEEQLYGPDENLNHRIRSRNMPIYAQLFESDEWNESLVCPLIRAGARKMEDKLNDYAKAHLPGGKYWNPDPIVTTTLKSLKPNNDVCESILGLNDYLTTAIPNMHQMTRSNLTEVKKNKTIKWYQELSPCSKQTITHFAIKNKQTVVKQYCLEERRRSEQRQRAMEQSYQRRKAMREKAAKEKEFLSHQHLIKTTSELKESLKEIDVHTNTTASKRIKEKYALLRTQINIRKKVLKQNIKIPFSHHGKKKPLADIIQSLTDFIKEHPELPEDDCSVKQQIEISDPFSLIGKNILHKFKLDSGEDQWFRGMVLSYDSNTRTHELVYEGETEHCHFNLCRDISDGDLKTID